MIDEIEFIAASDVNPISKQVINVTIAEGKYHQLKRMVAAIYNRAKGIKCIQIDELTLPEDFKVV